MERKLVGVSVAEPLQSLFAIGPSFREVSPMGVVQEMVEKGIEQPDALQHEWLALAERVYQGEHEAATAKPH
jgi:hypothetical protein